jgi:acylphosphatase
MLGIERVHIWVHGRVQGVGFRYHTHARATALGLMGFVCNLPSGQVEIVAEGAPQALGELLEWVNQGPPGANVTQVDINRLPATGEFSDFLILR